MRGDSAMYDEISKMFYEKNAWVMFSDNSGTLLGLVWMAQFPINPLWAGSYGRSPKAQWKPELHVTLTTSSPANSPPSFVVPISSVRDVCSWLCIEPWLIEESTIRLVFRRTDGKRQEALTAIFRVIR